MASEIDIERMLTGGFDVLQDGRDMADSVDQRNKEMVFASRQQAYENALIIARPFSGKAGQAALALLRQMTIEQPAFFPASHPLNDGTFVQLSAAEQGFLREGQNSMYREICRQITIAEAGPPTASEVIEDE